MASKNDMDIGQKNAEEEMRSSEKIQRPVSMDKIGSEEFYQGEKIIEDIALPGEKKIIRSETVPKEEIYEDKIKKQKDFIASLGRKNEASEKSGKDLPEYVEENKKPGKKIFLALLVIIVLGALVGGGYWVWSKKKQKIVSNEIPQQVVVPVEEPAQESSDEKQTVTEDIRAEEIKSSEIAIKVLNVGAATGSAGKIKNVLVSQGYTKTEAGNGQEAAIAKSYVFYKEEKFKEKAEAVSSLLLKEKKLSTEVKAASSVEEKSADIVVELGKN